MDNYEERQMSTYALTMYRHVAELDGKEYKVGKFKSIVLTLRYLGHCRAGLFQYFAPIILFWSSRCNSGKPRGC